MVTEGKTVTMEKKLGDIVKEARTLKKLSMSELGRRVGITTQSIKDIERHYSIPTEENISKLASILDLDERELFKLSNKIPSWLMEKVKKEYYEEKDKQGK